MHILHIDTGTAWRGGQQQVLLLLEGCRTLGIAQTLLAPAGAPLAERARQAGIEVVLLPRQGLALANCRLVRRLAPDFDLIHAHDSHAHSLVCAAQPLRGWGGRYPPLIVARRVGFPVGSMGRSKYRAAALYIAVSEYVRWRLIAAEVPAEKIHVVYDGVSVPLELPAAATRQEFRLHHGAGDGDFVLGTLSGFAPEKLLAEELDLLRQLPPSTQFWLGVPAAEPDPGSVGTALLETARRHGLSRRFRIVPVGENPGPFLAGLDLFIYLSRMEGLGSAILLAMAYELPVVASDVGGIPEIVQHGQSGVLVKADGEKELPAAIRFLMGSPTIRRRMGAAGRQFVFANASSDKMVAQTFLLYQKLLQRSLRTRA